MYKIDDVIVVGQLYLISLIGVITLKMAHTVDNQNFETALTFDTNGLRENLRADVRLTSVYNMSTHFTEFCI